MADLTVQPSYQLKETDILTVDKINLMATPIVSLAIETPVSDVNFFRNGNFYSSFWSNPGGSSCPIGVETQNADYWLVNPNGAAITSKRSTVVPDAYSLWSLELDGASNVTDCSVGQQINGDLSATLRRPSTFSGNIENNSGSNLSPLLEIWTANAFNNFATITLQTTVNLQTIPYLAWGYLTATIDLSTLTNTANGLFIKVRLPSGTLSSTTKRVNFSRLKFQLGEVATQFVDDPSLFIQAPSVDSTMLQDGCLARPSLYVTNPGVIPQGAFAPNAIQSGDIGAGQVTASNLAPGATTGNLGYTPINKAGDRGISGLLEFDNDFQVTTDVSGAAIMAQSKTQASNDAYMPAISFIRGGVFGRAIGLSTTGRFKTSDHGGKVGYLLDTVTGVDTASYQPGSITLAALAQSLINIIVPPGMIRMYAGPGCPAGWLWCDGSIVPIATYPALHAAIGNYWGAGDGSGTNFNLPDFRGRSPLGYVFSAAPGITPRTFAERLGEETHVLTVNELAYHDHTLTDSQHTHGLTQTPHQHSYVNPIGSLGAQPGSLQYSPAGTSLTSAQNANISVNNASSNISIAYTGLNYGHNNMQPYAVLSFIVKT